MGVEKIIVMNFAEPHSIVPMVDQLETQLAAYRSTGKNLLDAIVAELTNN